MQCQCPTSDIWPSPPCLPPVVPLTSTLPLLLSQFQRIHLSLWLYLTHPDVGINLPLSALFKNPCQRIHGTQFDGTAPLPINTVFYPAVCSAAMDQQDACSVCCIYLERYLLLCNTLVCEYPNHIVSPTFYAQLPARMRVLLDPFPHAPGVATVGTTTGTGHTDTDMTGTTGTPTNTSHDGSSKTSGLSSSYWIPFLQDSCPVHTSTLKGALAQENYMHNSSNLKLPMSSVFKTTAWLSLTEIMGPILSTQLVDKTVLIHVTSSKAVVLSGVFSSNLLTRQMLDGQKGQRLAKLLFEASSTLFPPSSFELSPAAASDAQNPHSHPSTVQKQQHKSTHNMRVSVTSNGTSNETIHKSREYLHQVIVCTHPFFERHCSLQQHQQLEDAVHRSVDVNNRSISTRVKHAHDGDGPMYSCLFSYRYCQYYGFYDHSSGYLLGHMRPRLVIPVARPILAPKIAMRIPHPLMGARGYNGRNNNSNVNTKNTKRAPLALKSILLPPTMSDDGPLSSDTPQSHNTDGRQSSIHASPPSFTPIATGRLYNFSSLIARDRILKKYKSLYAAYLLPPTVSLPQLSSSPLVPLIVESPSTQSLDSSRTHPLSLHRRQQHVEQLKRKRPMKDTNMTTNANSGITISHTSLQLRPHSTPRKQKKGRAHRLAVPDDEVVQLPTTTEPVAIDSLPSGANQSSAVPHCEKGCEDQHQSEFLPSKAASCVVDTASQPPLSTKSFLKPKDNLEVVYSTGGDDLPQYYNPYYRTWILCHKAQEMLRKALLLEADQVLTPKLTRSLLYPTIETPSISGTPMKLYLTSIKQYKYLLPPSHTSFVFPLHHFIHYVPLLYDRVEPTDNGHHTHPSLLDTNTGAGAGAGTDMDSDAAADTNAAGATPPPTVVSQRFALASHQPWTHLLIAFIYGLRTSYRSRFLDENLPLLSYRLLQPPTTTVNSNNNSGSDSTSVPVFDADNQQIDEHCQKQQQQQQSGIAPEAQADDVATMSDLDRLLRSQTQSQPQCDDDPLSDPSSHVVSARPLLPVIATHSQLRSLFVLALGSPFMYVACSAVVLAFESPTIHLFLTPSTLQKEIDRHFFPPSIIRLPCSIFHISPSILLLIFPINPCPITRAHRNQYLSRKMIANLSPIITEMMYLHRSLPYRLVLWTTATLPPRDLDTIYHIYGFRLEDGVFSLRKDLGPSQHPTTATTTTPPIARHRRRGESASDVETQARPQLTQDVCSQYLSMVRMLNKSQQPLSKLDVESDLVTSNPSVAAAQPSPPSSHMEQDSIELSGQLDPATLSTILGNISQLYTPVAQVQEYLRSCLELLIPIRLFGSKYNKQRMIDNILRVVFAKKQDSLTSYNLIIGLKLSHIAWISPPTTKSNKHNKRNSHSKHHSGANDSDQQQHYLVTRMATFLTDYIAIPLLTTAFKRVKRENSDDMYYIYYLWKTLEQLAKLQLSLSFSSTNDFDSLIAKVITTQQHQNKTSAITNHTIQTRLPPPPLQPPVASTPATNQTSDAGSNTDSATDIPRTNSNSIYKNAQGNSALGVVERRPTIYGGDKTKRPTPIQAKSIEHPILRILTSYAISNHSVLLANLQLVMKKTDMRFIVNHSLVSFFRALSHRAETLLDTYTSRKTPPSPSFSPSPLPSTSPSPSPSFSARHPPLVLRTETSLTVSSSSPSLFPYNLHVNQNEGDDPPSTKEVFPLSIVNPSMYQFVTKVSSSTTPSHHHTTDDETTDLSILFPRRITLQSINRGYDRHLDVLRASILTQTHKSMTASQFVKSYLQVVPLQRQLLTTGQYTMDPTPPTASLAPTAASMREYHPTMRKVVTAPQMSCSWAQQSSCCALQASSIAHSPSNQPASSSPPYVTPVTLPFSDQFAPDSTYGTQLYGNMVTSSDQVHDKLLYAAHYWSHSSYWHEKHFHDTLKLLHLLPGCEGSICDHTWSGPITESEHPPAGMPSMSCHSQPQHHPPPTVFPLAAHASSLFGQGWLQAMVSFINSLPPGCHAPNTGHKSQFSPTIMDDYDRAYDDDYDRYHEDSSSDGDGSRRPSATNLQDQLVISLEWYYYKTFTPEYITDFFISSQEDPIYKAIPKYETADDDNPQDWLHPGCSIANILADALDLSEPQDESDAQGRGGFPPARDDPGFSEFEGVSNSEIRLFYQCFLFIFLHPPMLVTAMDITQCYDSINQTLLLDILEKTVFASDPQQRSDSSGGYVINTYASLSVLNGSVVPRPASYTVDPSYLSNSLSIAHPLLELAYRPLLSDLQSKAKQFPTNSHGLGGYPSYHNHARSTQRSLSRRPTGILSHTATLLSKRNILPPLLDMFPKAIVKAYPPALKASHLWQSSKGVQSAIKHLLSTTYLKMGSNYYKQSKGTPQGNVLSSLFANVYIGHIEQLALAKQRSLAASNANPPFKLATKMDVFLYLTSQSPFSASSIKLTPCGPSRRAPQAYASQPQPLAHEYCKDRNKAVILRKMDDLLILSPTVDQVSHISSILEQISHHQLRIKPEKTQSNYGLQIPSALPNTNPNKGLSPPSLTSAKTERRIHWNGVVLDTANMTVRIDFDRYLDNPLLNVRLVLPRSLPSSRGGGGGHTQQASCTRVSIASSRRQTWLHQFLRRSLSHRVSSLIVSPLLNGVRGVLLNIYESWYFTTVRLLCVIKRMYELQCPIINQHRLKTGVIHPPRCYHCHLLSPFVKPSSAQTMPVIRIRKSTGTRTYRVKYAKQVLGRPHACYCWILHTYSIDFAQIIQQYVQTYAAQVMQKLSKTYERCSFSSTPTHPPNDSKGDAMAVNQHAFNQCQVRNDASSQTGDAVSRLRDAANQRDRHDNSTTTYYHNCKSHIDDGFLQVFSYDKMCRLTPQLTSPSSKQAQFISPLNPSLEHPVSYREYIVTREAISNNTVITQSVVSWIASQAIYDVITKTLTTCLTHQRSILQNNVVAHDTVVNDKNESTICRTGGRDTAAAGILSQLQAQYMRCIDPGLLHLLAQSSGVNHHVKQDKQQQQNKKDRRRRKRSNRSGTKNNNNLRFPSIYLLINLLRTYSAPCPCTQGKTPPCLPHRVQDLSDRWGQASVASRGHHPLCHIPQLYEWITIRSETLQQQLHVVKP